MGSANAIPRQSEFQPIDMISIPSALPGTTRTKINPAEVFRYLNLMINGSFTVDGGGADGVLSSEGILSLITEVRVTGSLKSGKNLGVLKRIDLAAQYRLNQFLHGVSGMYLAPTPITKGSANSPFYVDVPIDFEMPFSKDPSKTLLKTGEFSDLFLEMDWAALSPNVFTAGTVTAGTTPITCRVMARQFSDAGAKLGRYLYHVQGYQEKAVSAATTDFRFELRHPGSRLRGVLIKQFTRNGVTYHTPVDTVINSIQLQCDRKVRKNFPTLNVLKAENQDQYKVTPPTGYTFLDLMPDKDYNSSVDMTPFGAVDVVLDVNAIANAVVRVYPIEIVA